MKVLRMLQDERGQVLPLMAMLLVSFIALLGLAIDAGRLYVARAEMSRALDAAALAGVLELPDVSGAQSRASVYMQENQPDVAVEFPAAGQNQFRVKGSREVPLLFMRIVGFDAITIGGQAAAGFGIVPADTVMLLDATGSMGSSPCNGSQNNSGCPIWEAKQAAADFADFFLADNVNGFNQVGFTPFRGCHNPPRTHSGCATNAMRVDLTSNLGAVDGAITNTSALGGTGTNVCLALYKAREMFEGPNANGAPNTVRSIVILSDGDNTYNASSYSNWQGAPPNECRPSSGASSSDGNVGSNCSNAQARERSVDVKTKQIADELRGDGIEIYIVAFGVCGSYNSSTATTSYCNGIGNFDHDNTADQRLLKCIASSTAGTNDHYFRAETTDDLPQVFQSIAHAIAFRLIE